MSNLKDKVVIITGASSGLGRGAALEFANLGAKLSISGRNVENLQATVSQCEKAGLPAENILSLQADLAKDEDVKKIIDETIKKFGQLDVLVNNAGIVKPGSIETQTMEDYDYTMNINVRCHFYMTKLAVPHLIKTKGSVVNVSSVNGMRSFPGVISYCMSKSAIDQFTRCCALELAQKGVRVNSVNPGVIVTDLHKRGGMDGEAYGKFLEHCKTTHAMGRVGQPEEVAKAIVFLASSDSSFITGASIPIDGGRHAIPGVIMTAIHQRGGMDDEAYAKFLEHCKTTHAMGRAGQPEEVAKAIVFLASSDSSFITGASIPIDGGRHAMCPR